MITFSSKAILSVNRLSKVLSSCTLILLGCENAYADLNSEINLMFDEMHNTSVPRAYMTERRGVVSGGSVVTRSYIRDLSPIGVAAPKVKAGCGGIDLYGGSFSYINKDEFVSFLRSVAANAKGYAFSIALSSMCEKCFQHMETLQRKVMELNTYFGNSCQLAQGIVNDSLGAFERKGLNDASLIGQFKGIGDVFELNSEPEPANVYEKAKQGSADDAKAITGNIMWQMLMINPIFKTDPDLAEAVMSMTGTYITNEGGELVSSAPGGLVGLRELVEGGQIRRYHCDSTGDDGCLNLTVHPENLKGLAQRLEEMLLGPNLDGTQGIVGKLTTNNGSFTVAETAFINSLPSGTFARIRTLSAVSPGSTVSFVESSSKVLALSMAKSLVKDYILAAVGSLRLSKHAYKEAALKEIHHTQNMVTEEALHLSSSYGTEKDLLELYELLMRAVKVKSYLDAEGEE